MKIARIFASVFGILGLVLMLSTAVVCFSSLDSEVRAEIPRETRDCAQEVAQLLSQGDLSGVQAKLYGNPGFGLDQTMSEEAAAVWEIYCSNLSCELVSDVYVSGSSFAVDAVVTVPRIASITDTIGTHARTLLDERIAAAEKMNELYDENNEFRQDVIDGIMAQAAELAFAEDPELLTFETTFGFAYQANQWYLVPDSTLMRALSGGL